jgi:methionyl-tRNA formyltransferase
VKLATGTLHSSWLKCKGIAAASPARKLTGYAAKSCPLPVACARVVTEKRNASFKRGEELHRFGVHVNCLRRFRHAPNGEPAADSGRKKRVSPVKPFGGRSMRVAFFGSDYFYSCLLAIVRCGHTVVRVFSQPCDNVRFSFNKKVESFALDMNIPMQIGPPRLADITQLIDGGCDIIVSAAYRYKIPIEPERAVIGINVHPSLLPVGRGPWPTPWLILKGHSESGVTIHVLTDEFDAGDILLQDRFELSEHDNYESVSVKTQLMAGELMSKFLLDHGKYLSDRKPQTAGEYWPYPSATDRTVNWEAGVEQIHRVVRAFGNCDCYANFDNKTWAVRDAAVCRIDHRYAPGQVIHRQDNTVIVTASDGVVHLKNIRALTG